MKSKVLPRLVALESKADKVLFGVYRDPVTGEYIQSDGTGKTVEGAVKTVAAGGAIGAGVIGARKLMKRYGADQVAKTGDALKATAVGIGRDIEGAAGAAKAAGAKGVMAGRISWGRNAASGRPLLTKVGRALRAGVTAASGGRIKFSEVRDRIVEMAEKRDYTTGNRVRALLIGGPLALPNAEAASKAGQKYRMTDGIVDGGVVGVGAGGGAAVGAAGGLGAAKLLKLKNPGPAALVGNLAGALGGAAAGYVGSRRASDRRIAKRASK